MSNLLAAMFRWVAYVFLRNEWHTVKRKIRCVHCLLEQNPNARAPLIAQQLLISGEDHRFFSHPGFDLIAIGRAIWKRLRRRGIEGASTIEQQLVRVLTQRFERTVTRKVREILLSSLVASEFKKEILPSIYLHLGYYGWNLHGFENASRKLDKPEASTLVNTASIVARLKYPEPRHYSITRQEKIGVRTQHLIRLHNVHLRDGTYEPIANATISDRFTAAIPES